MKSLKTKSKKVSGKPVSSKATVKSASGTKSKYSLGKIVKGVPVIKVKPKML